MHLNQVRAAAAASLLWLASAAQAQLLAQADAGTAQPPGSTATTAPPTPVKKKPAKSTKTTKTPAKKKSTKKKKKPAAPPAAQKEPGLAPPPAAPPPEAAASCPGDNQPPVITHSPVSKSQKGKPVQITASISDPCGVFQPILYLRKKGLAGGDFIPVKMIPSKIVPDEYVADVAPLLASADLEYYIEAYDNAGNGPARAGGPDQPFWIKVEEPPKPVVKIEKKGAPPAITHSAVPKAEKGQAIEIHARLVGETGVSNPTVMFRRVGEKDYTALPMGNIGGDDYTSTIPAQMATGDIEYYVEAFDKFGNGPSRSAAPNVPYRIQVVEKRPEPAPLPPPPPPQPRVVKAPFSPNPGRTAAWLFMAGFVGGAIFAGGEALGGLQTHNVYQHTFEYEGRIVPELNQRANDYMTRARTAAIVSGAALAVGVTLLVLFPAHPDTMVVTGGGDGIAVRF